MIDERYPSKSWILVYTDGSAKNAVKYGGAGVHIIFSNGETVKPNQQASIAQATKQKWKRSSTLHTPPETEWMKTHKSSF